MNVAQLVQHFDYEQQPITLPYEFWYHVSHLSGRAQYRFINLNPLARNRYLPFIPTPYTNMNVQIQLIY